MIPYCSYRPSPLVGPTSPYGRNSGLNRMIPWRDCDSGSRLCRIAVHTSGDVFSAAIMELLSKEENSNR